MQHRFFLFIFTAASSAWVPKQHRWYVHQVQVHNTSLYVKVYKTSNLNITSILMLLSIRVIQGQQDDLVSNKGNSRPPFHPSPWQAWPSHNFTIWAKQIAKQYTIFPSSTFGDLLSLTTRFPLTVLSLLVYRQSKQRVWGFKGQGLLPVLKVWLLVIYLTIQKLSQPCWRGSAILQQCETQSLATTELLLKGSKDHQGLRGSSTQGLGQVGMRLMRTRLPRKGLGLAVQGQVCGGGNFFTLSFLFNLLPLSTVCQPGTNQQRGLVPFSRGLAARCP